MSSTRSLLRRAFAGAASVAVAASALFLVGATQAHATQNSEIKVTSMDLQHVTETGAPVTAARQLITGDYFYLNVAWDASQANPQPGDSFTVALPDHFDNRDAGNSQRTVVKPLEYREADGTTVKAGECKVEQRLITCTFGEAIADKVDIKGTLQAQLVARGTTAETSSSISFNGVPQAVAHPWGEDIVPAPVKTFTPDTRAQKGSKGVSIASTSINWRIVMGGTWLKNNYPNGGPVTITDEIQAGMEVPEVSSITLVRVGADPATGRATDTVVARGDGTGQVDGFTVTPSFDGKVVTFALTGPFSPEYDYRVDYDTAFTGGATITPGHQYTNEAYFVEAQRKAIGSRSYFESFKATVSYRQGFGGFEVTKATAGDVVPPAGQKFTVTVAYQLPDGKTAADYSDWNAPANPTTLEVTVGQTTVYPAEFPAGTVLTLTEDVATANPAASGWTWGTPAFSSTNSAVTISDDKTSATFTVVDGQAMPITLTNTATATPAEPSTPAPTTPSEEPSVVPSPAAPSSDPAPSAEASPSGGASPSATASASATPTASATTPVRPTPPAVKPSLPKTGS